MVLSFVINLKNPPSPLKTVCRNDKLTADLMSEDPRLIAWTMESCWAVDDSPNIPG